MMSDPNDFDVPSVLFYNRYYNWIIVKYYNNYLVNLIFLLKINDWCLAVKKLSRSYKRDSKTTFRNFKKYYTHKNIVGLKNATYVELGCVK